MIYPEKFINADKTMIRQNIYEWPSENISLNFNNNTIKYNSF